MPEVVQISTAFIGGTAGLIALIWIFHKAESAVRRRKDTKAAQAARKIPNA